MNAVTERSTRATQSALRPVIDGACARIAPTWPLDRFIAVNPHWGHLERPIAIAAANPRRAGGEPDADAAQLVPRALAGGPHHRGAPQGGHRGDGRQLHGCGTGGEPERDPDLPGTPAACHGSGGRPPRHQPPHGLARLRHASREPDHGRVLRPGPGSLGTVPQRRPVHELAPAVGARFQPGAADGLPRLPPAPAQAALRPDRAHRCRRARAAYPG